jgi:hypothetical protein
MNKGKKRYEPPVACDLTGITVRGQTSPNSTCGNGSRPGTGSCRTGFLPFGSGTCSPTGSNPVISGCNAGLIATPVRCSNGSVPAPS